MAGWKLSFENFDFKQRLQSEETMRDPPPRVMTEVFFRLQRGSIKKMKRYVEGVRRRGIDLRLITSDGLSMDEVSIPPELTKFVRQNGKNIDGQIIVTKTGDRFSTFYLIRRDLGPFIVAVKKSGKARPWRADPSNRVFVAIFISGALCFILTWFLTKRLSLLKKASAELANGNFDVPISSSSLFFDEIDSLAEDLASMAEKFKERTALQSRFLADVSHELRSPLARIQLALTLAESSSNGRENHLQRVRLEAERLDDMIGKLIASQREISSLREWTDILQLVEALLIDAEIEAQDKNIVLSLSAETGPWLVMSDRGLLQGVFENILRNAITHSPSRGEIRIELSSVFKDKVEISIFDQGSGVPDTDLDRIFDPFFRVENARDRYTGGTGLGLAIAKRTVEQHGGNIVAKNTGEGFCVQVELPVLGT